jgi:putative glutamine amidotransferase
MRPLVLIVGRNLEETKGVRGEPFGAGRRYFHAIDRAGGVPIMLPPMPSLVDDIGRLMGRVDAVVLHGGGDIDPRRYGQEATTEQLYGVVHEHDEVEIAVVQAAIEQGVPMLAICRGMQVLNVAMGGTLVQDIGTEDHWKQWSSVEVMAGSRLAAALAAESVDRCHCVHHQALDRIADGLRVTARTADGIVHAVETTIDDAWVLATQWHPEDSAHSDANQQALFDALLHHA